MSTDDWKFPYPAMTEEKLAELKKKHPEVHELKNEFASVWIRRPGRAEYRLYEADIAAGGERTRIADEQLLRSTLVYPDAAGLEALLDRWPALITDFSNPMLHLLGVTNRARHSKS